VTGCADDEPLPRGGTALHKNSRIVFCLCSQSLLAWGAALGVAYVLWVRPDQQRREQIEVRRTPPS
jgi:hypothetical protein